jgi:hypothetical protein
MEARLAALSVARLAVRDTAGDSTATIQEVAIAFGSVHPEIGTIRAIRAVVDQLEHPSAFTRNRDAYEKHSASRSTYEKWKGKITSLLRSATSDELDDDEFDDDALSEALTRRNARLSPSDTANPEQLFLVDNGSRANEDSGLEFLISSPPGTSTSSVLEDAAAAAGVTVEEAMSKVTNRAPTHAEAHVLSLSPASLSFLPLSLALTLSTFDSCGSAHSNSCRPACGGGRSSGSRGG